MAAVSVRGWGIAACLSEAKVEVKQPLVAVFRGRLQLKKQNH